MMCMKLKLKVDGADQRIAVISADKADRKLLEYLAEWDYAEINIKKDTYSRDITEIELRLSNHKLKEGQGKEMLYPSV